MGNCNACLNSEDQSKVSKKKKRKKGGTRERKPNPFSEDPVCSPAPIRVLKDVVPISHRSRIGDKYILGRELGRGEFGITYLCTDRETKEALACKSISKKKLRTAIDIEDVRREVAIMSSLPDHPNVVRLRATYEDNEAVHLVMELCEGGELFDRIVARGHYSERAAANVARTVAEVVKMCHEHGVIHRDLKPENFLFANKRENSLLKAIDFGLSVFFRPGERFSEIVGSPYYMAPEVLKRNYGPEVDIWSAGVILYILLCGVPPFWAETEQGVAQAILRGSIDFKRDPWPLVSDGAKSLVRQMLEPDPRKRLTAQQVLEHSWLQNAKKASNVPLGDIVRTRLRQFSVMNRLKKKAMRVIAEHLSVEEVEVIRDMFKLMDTDNNGKITYEELRAGLQKIGSRLAEPEMKMLMEVADVDGNGTLDYGEFVTVTIHLQKMENDEHFRQAFLFFDRDGSGYIETDELRESLTDESGPADDEVVNDILREVDTDKIMQPRRKGASGSREPSQPCYTQSSQPNLQPSLQPTPEPGYQQSFQQNWTPWISQPNFPSHPSYSQSSHPPSNYRLHSSAPHHPHSSQPPIYEYQSSPPTYFPFQTQPNPQYPEYQSSPPAYFPFQTKPNPQYPEYQPSHPHVATQSGSQETVQPPPLTAPRRRAQSKGKSTGIEAGHRGPNLREEEDVALAKAFVAVGEDEEVGNKQKYAAMWKRIMEAFYEFMPDAIQRPVNMMQHRWAKMSKDVQTFNGLMRLHERNRQSGWTQEDVLNAARSDFREKANCAWKFDACWEVLKECPKWSRQSTTLNNLHNSVGRPGGSSSTSTPISLTSDVSMNDVYANLEPSLPRPAGKKTVTAEKRRKATNDKWDQQEVERAARLQAATESIQAFVEVKKKKVVAKKSSKLELLKQKKLSRFRKEDERLTFMDIRHLDDEQLQLRQARLHGLAEKIAALEKEDEDEDED